MHDSVSRVKVARSHLDSASQSPLTSVQYDSDGHAKHLPQDIAAWVKQVTIKNQELLTTYESMIHSSDKEISGFAFYAADEVRYHIRRLSEILKP